MRHIKCRCITVYDGSEQVEYTHRTVRTGFEVFFMKLNPVAEYTWSKHFPLIQVVLDGTYSAVFDSKNYIDWEFKYTFENPDGIPFLDNVGLGLAMMDAGLTEEEANEALKQLLSPPPYWRKHEN